MENFFDGFSKQLAKGLTRRDLLTVTLRTGLAALGSSTPIGKLWAMVSTRSGSSGCGDPAQLKACLKQAELAFQSCKRECPGGRTGDQCRSDCATALSAALQDCNEQFSPCPTGLRCCDGACVDTGSDPKNCGGCGNACQTSAICQNSSCVCAPPTCVSNQQNGTSLITASACTTAGASQFSATLTHSSGISSFSVGGGPETHLAVQRRRRPNTSATTSLQLDTKTNLNGAVQLSLLLGDGFDGVKQIMFTSQDRATVHGTIDGRAIAPFPIKSDPKSIKFADGSAIPTTTVDNESKQALPILLQAMHSQCPPPSGSTAPALRSQAADQPAHPPNFDQGPCILCTATAAAADFACLLQSLASANACDPLGLYPVCLAAEDAVCELAYLYALGNTCRLFGTPFGTVGPPCCPVGCTNGCCGAGETCAGPGSDPLFPTLCCSAGLTACDQNCCGAGETCVNGTCCPAANLCVGHVGPFQVQSCCGTGETCLPNGLCCAPSNVCGQNCCNAGDNCLANGTCCPAGHAVCGGVCCPNSTDVCDPVTNTCSCPGLSCGGTCCAAGQLCCQVQTSGGAQLQCVTPQSPTWCGQTAPNQIYCFNYLNGGATCPPGKQCLPGPCSGGLCSTNMYCQ